MATFSGLFVTPTTLALDEAAAVTRDFSLGWEAVVQGRRASGVPSPPSSPGQGGPYGEALATTSPQPPFPRSRALQAQPPLARQGHVGSRSAWRSSP